ncbi:MATE family efflux transporter [Clostridium thermarum]|uniref:MATE family efflux transporter n=1 Tax=Clostridium thermarum TaxID=1716543 RepID=UPI0013D693C5|nr:MATE family efflux transporter [Clostridium thermarum]
MIKKSNVKDVASLALPAVGEMILYMMIGVFDTMMVGQYGGNLAVSSVGLSAEIINTFNNIFISVGISVAVTSLVARRIGAKEHSNAEEYASLGFMTGIVLALCISALLFAYSGKILSLAGATDEVLAVGTVYMKIVSLGIFFNMLVNIMNAILRGSGNTKVPLLASLVINFINIFLDWVLIFGKLGMPELGVRGAAIATAIAHICGFIFICQYIRNKSTISIRLKYIKGFSVHKIKDLLKLAIPSSMQEGSFSISRLLSTFIIMSTGTIAFASNQIANTLESVSFMPGWGVAIAATTLVGHKIGEKDYKKAKEYANTSIFIGVVIMLLCSLIFLLFPRFLIRLFIGESEKEVIRLGTLCLRVASIEQPFLAVSMIAGGALKGSGDTKTPFMVSLISSWAIRLPLMYYLIYRLRLSVVFVWFITAIQWTFDGILLFILFKRKFKKGEISLESTSH